MTRLMEGVPATRQATVALVIASAPAALALVYRYPPGDTAFYPPCPVHQLTGLLCPGCGTTHALAALLHGNLAQALRFNGLFVALLPLVLAYAAVAISRAFAPGPYRCPTVPAGVRYGLLAAAAVFTVLRNLDG